MHFHAIAERPAAMSHAGVSWLLLGFVVLSLGIHALLLMPERENEQASVIHLGTPYIRVTLSEKPQPETDTARTTRPTEPLPRAEARPATSQRVAALTPATTPTASQLNKPRRASARDKASAQTAIKAASRAVMKESPHTRSAISATETADGNRVAKATPQTSNNTTQNLADSDRQHEALRNYLLGELRDQLSRYLTYPQRARRRGWEGEVLVKLDISIQGKLQNIQLIHSSGYAPLDRSALQSLARVERLQLPATNRLQQAISLQLPVIYQLNNQ